MATFSIWKADGSFLEVFIGDKDAVSDRLPAGGAYHTSIPKSPDATLVIVDDVKQIVEPDPVIEERKVMTPFIAAFDLAMLQVDAPIDGPSHLLEYVSGMVSTVRASDPFNTIVIWHSRVTQILRNHPDMATFRDIVFVNPPVSMAPAQADLKVDALCRLALAIEQSKDSQTIADLIATYEAIT